MTVDVTAVIPARYGSTRFEAKCLADKTGKTLIEHVVDQVAKAALVSDIIVATDDQRIVAAVDAFGGRAVMTRADHPNGTSRIAEVAAAIHAPADALSRDQPIIVNVQGDEPEI